jgi:hypothetical protein
MSFKQLRIRAYPRTGIISDQYLPLDSILYYHLVRRAFGEQLISKVGESNVRKGANITLPIKKAGRKDDTWFYSCSFAQWSTDVREDSSFKVKQGDWLRHISYYKGTKKIQQRSGKFKSYHIKMYYRHASFVEWYCIGNPVEIAELLRFCTHVGKNAGDGWGEVANWEIKNWPEDWSIRGPQNKLMRAVPDEKSNFVYGLRPSYWNSKHIFPVKMP